MFWVTIWGWTGLIAIIGPVPDTTVCIMLPPGANISCCCGTAGAAAKLPFFFLPLFLDGDSLLEDPGEDDLEEDPLLEGLDC